MAKDYVYKNFLQKNRLRKVYRKTFCHCHPKNPQTVGTTGFEAAKVSAKVYCHLCPFTVIAARGFFLEKSTDGGNPRPIMSTYIPHRWVGYAQEVHKSAEKRQK